MSLPATALIALMKAQGVRFRSDESKIPYAVHTFLIASGCCLVSCGSELSAEKSVTEADEVAADGWDADASLFVFQYRTPRGSSLVTKCLPMDHDLILHWCCGGNDAPVRSLELHIPDYIAKGSTADTAFGNLQGLIDTVSPGLSAELQGTQAAPAAAGQRPAQAGEQAHGATAEPIRDRQSREPGQPAERPAQPVLPGDAERGIGYDDLHPPGTLLVEGPARGGRIGGSQVGPDDPLFSVRPGRQPVPSQSLPPGARFDPIGPEGVPGFHPDDFTPERMRREAWNDVGPPPGMFHPEGVDPGLPRPGRGRGSGRGGSSGFGSMGPGFGGDMFG